MKKYALIGAAGYIAPKHMEAIKNTGGQLVAALDPHDSVGILDSYFPDCHFFTDFSRFDRHCSAHLTGELDYVVVCSPNYLHDTHCRFGLRIGADVICEKPLTINSTNLAALMAESESTNHRINVILQSRLHPNYEKISPIATKVEIMYASPRGNWYDYSWKGDIEKSGGIPTNIGIHLFDILIQKYGFWNHIDLKINTNRTVAGKIYFNTTEVRFFLTITAHKPIREFIVDGTAIDFSNGFFDLHTKSYEEILLRRGFNPSDIYDATVLAETIRNTEVTSGNKRF